MKSVGWQLSHSSVYEKLVGVASSKWCYGEGRKPSSIGKIRNVVGAHKLWLLAVITKHTYVARLS